MLGLIASFNCDYISDLLISLTGGVFPETNVIQYMIESSVVISILQFNDLVFPKTIDPMNMHQQPQKFVWLEMQLLVCG